MLLGDIVDTSQALSRTRSRKEKIRHLEETLARLTPDEIRIGVEYLAGNLPQGRIGIGYALLNKIRSEPDASASGLTLAEVDGVFDDIAATKGRGSAAAREKLLRGLFGRATADEQHFLARLLIGELRQGALDGVMVEALAKASDIAAGHVRRAVMLSGRNLAGVAEAALTQGAPGLAQFKIEVLEPIEPMLAQPAEDLEDALSQIGRAGIEYKLDGARVQAHKRGEEIRVFTRRLNDVTAAVPEVVEALKKVPASVLLLDGETIAVREDGRPHPFQTTMRRFGRKLDLDVMRERLPLTVFFFDCLHLEGEDLIDSPNDERFSLMADALPSELLIPRLVTGDIAEARGFMAKALDDGHEGVMVKVPEAPYEAGRRGSSWLKVKPVHTLDLVVLAAEWGSGRRRGYLSNLHLGARDAASGEFVMLGKTFKGLTDEMLKWQTAKLQELELSRDRYTVYVRPELVVEIAFNNVQESPQYPGGLALRFARVKHHRPDKAAGDADTFESIQRIHAGDTR